jgi:hypothetical protein
MVAMGPTTLATLEGRLSGERLAPYRAACGGDLAAAVALYEWNADVSAALGTTLGHLEILLRNAMHTELTRWTVARFGEPWWYLDPARVLSAESLAYIVQAVRGQRAETAGRVVAELPLGFWRFLLARNYDRGLWHPCLNRAFGRRRRSAVHDAVKKLNDARNRMAHHEPMFNRPISDLRTTALEVAGWICPVTRDWIDAGCRVSQLLATRPDAHDPRRTSSAAVVDA